MKQFRIPYIPNGVGPPSNFILIVFVVLTSIVFGVAAAIFPWWWMIAIVLSIVFIYIGFSIPIIGLIGILAIICNLIRETFLPSLHILGGTIKAADLALIITCISCLLRYHSYLSAAKLAIKPLIVPLMLMFFLIGVSIFQAIILFHLPIKDILGESKNFIYWLLLPLFALACLDQRRFKYAVVGLLVIAFLFSLGQIAQGVFDINVYGKRFESLETLGQVSSGVTRSVTNGIHILVWAFLFVIILFV